MATNGKTTITPQQVLDYWFADGMQQYWFASTPQLDQEIRERFVQCWEDAASGKLDHWAETADGTLALIIVLDQFPLNMFRGDAMSFSTEQKAVAIARQAIAQGLDKQIGKDRLAFFYMPLMHSESLPDQDLSVQLFDDAGLQHNLKFARHHRDIIRRFGRFPHRNDALGRHSTHEEKHYLASDEAFKG